MTTHAPPPESQAVAEALLAEVGLSPDGTRLAPPPPSPDEGLDAVAERESATLPPPPLDTPADDRSNAEDPPSATTTQPLAETASSPRAEQDTAPDTLFDVDEPDPAADPAPVARAGAAVVNDDRASRRADPGTAEQRYDADANARRESKPPPLPPRSTWTSGMLDWHPSRRVVAAVGAALVAAFLLWFARPGPDPTTTPPPSVPVATRHEAGRSGRATRAAVAIKRRHVRAAQQRARAARRAAAPAARRAPVPSSTSTAPVVAASPSTATSAPSRSWTPPPPPARTAPRPGWSEEFRP